MANSTTSQQGKPKRVAKAERKLAKAQTKLDLARTKLEKRKAKLELARQRYEALVGTDEGETTCS
jgi:outer membrane protein TolC